MFGDWIYNTSELNNKFNNGQPYQHVIINNFFSEEYINTLIDKFPDISNNKWHIYHNPIEKKYALNNFEKYPEYDELFKTLQTPEFVKLMSEISGINNLENDPYLHGAGLHYHPSGGKLDMHLDYSIHPISGKERCINLIIYLNKDWKEEYNGDIQLWDSEFTYPVKRVYPTYNTALLFRTSDISWHGLPTPINCPDGFGRKSIAIYYVSEPRENITHRYKASFRPLPNQPCDERLKKLYDIRKTRIITKDELNSIYPNWEKDGNGYW